MTKAKEPAVQEYGSPYDVYETDTDLEANGVWLDFGTFRLKCAASGEANPEFMRVYGEKISDIRQALDKDLIPDGKNVERRFLAEAYGETVVKDADGNFVDKEGEPIPKTPEGYAQLLINLPRLFEVVRRRTLSIESFRAKTGKEAGNA